MKTIKHLRALLVMAALASLCILPTTALASMQPTIGEPPVAEPQMETAGIAESDDGASISTTAAYEKPAVAYHSADEIRDYIFNNPVYVYNQMKWDKEPSLSAPYAAGALSQETLNDALCLLNCYRYIAGLNDDVSLDSTYTEKCQAGALVNAVNNELSHFPTQPADMPNELYELGKSGCGSSNIACGQILLQRAVMDWVDDTDDYNIETLGHRRWVLNPYMGKTGFGAVYNPDSWYGLWYSMYSFDSSNTSATEKNVAWPAQNTPIHLFGSNQAWSLSTGYTLDASQVKVTVKSVKSGKVWSFSQASADGYFNVDNDGYGQRGCVIFLPNGITADDGDSYTVTVDGIPTPVSYTVNFFSLYQKITAAKLSATTFTYNGSAQKPTATVYAGSKVLKQGADYTISYANNKNAGTATATITGKGRYDGELKRTFKINPKKVAVSFALKAKSVVLSSSQAKCGVKSVRAGSTTLSNSQYTVTYAKNKAVGKASVTVKLKGNYTGSKTLTFKIVPKKTANVKLKALSKGMKVSWKAGAALQASGYEVRYDTSKSTVTKAKVKATITKRTTASKTFKNLKANKKYYVQVRTYKKVGGVKYYGSWSAAKTVTVKK